MVIRFGSVQEATSYVSETSQRFDDITLGGPEGGAVLYLKMPPDDADAATAKLCL